jgi:DNA-binding NarL/FixJ family response regulator
MSEASKPETLRILVADDHPVFRYGMRAILSSKPDVELVGEARDGKEAVDLALELRPDVILMDINMPGMDGIEATRSILEELPAVGILVLTMVEEDDSVFAAIRSGARGYLLKGADGEETMRAIRAVAGGEAIFGPAIAGRLTGYFAAWNDAARPFPELTERELDVLDLIARGRTNAAIAEALYLSPKTVRNYASNIFTKLQVADRAQAIIRAREAGLGREGAQ